jgi:hypothetical protein
MRKTESDKYKLFYKKRFTQNFSGSTKANNGTRT